MVDYLETITSQVVARLKGSSSIPCMQKRLERNERDIAQFMVQLHSYHYEPKTYEQYMQLVALKDKARAFRNANMQIGMALRSHKQETLGCAEQLQGHLRDFEVFSQAVRNYLGENKRY